MPADQGEESEQLSDSTERITFSRLSVQEQNGAYKEQSLPLYGVRVTAIKNCGSPESLSLPLISPLEAREPRPDQGGQNTAFVER